MKQLISGITTLISFWLFADSLPEFLSIFGLTYFVWFIIGIALTHAGYQELKNSEGIKNRLSDYIK